MKKELYTQHLEEAEIELVNLLQRRSALDNEIAQKKKDIGLLRIGDDRPKGLLRLLMGGVKLPDACREVLKAASEPLTASEIVGGLVQIGYDISETTNMLASVYTTMRRMEDEIKETTKNGIKAFTIRPTMLPATLVLADRIGEEGKQKLSVRASPLILRLSRESVSRPDQASQRALSKSAAIRSERHQPGPLPVAGSL